MTSVESGTLASVRAHRAEILAIAERHHASSLRVFGSVARGEERVDSDIDFLVNFDKATSLFDLLHLQEELSALLERPVDVVSEAALKPRDQHVRSEAVPV